MKMTLCAMLSCENVKLGYIATFWWVIAFVPLSGTNRSLVRFLIEKGFISQVRNGKASSPMIKYDMAWHHWEVVQLTESESLELQGIKDYCLCNKAICPAFHPQHLPMHENDGMEAFIYIIIPEGWLLLISSIPRFFNLQCRVWLQMMEDFVLKYCVNLWLYHSK